MSKRGIDSEIISLTNEELDRLELITQRVKNRLDKQSKLTDDEEKTVDVAVLLVFLEMKP